MGLRATAMRTATRAAATRVAAALTLAAAVLVSACEGDEQVSLSERIPCDIEGTCPEGTSCLDEICVEDGTIPEGERCTLQPQCEVGLVCRDEICSQGCLDLYYIDACTEETWCKPEPDTVINTPAGPVTGGLCSPSECNPSLNDFCSDGAACVAITADIGACLPYCQYGFDNGRYFDTCFDTVTLDQTCQPLGLTSVPVCLPAGDDEAPGVGLPGCDAVRNPCESGSVCSGVVCRALCTPGQLDPCVAGEICTPVGERTDVSFCVAD